MKITGKVISNSFYIFLQWFFSALFGYIFWVVLGKLLSPEEVGGFSTIINMALLITGFSFLGINSAMSKLLPQYQIKKQTKKLGATIRWTLKTLSAINLLISSVIFIFADFISIFYLDPLTLRLISITVIVYSLFYFSSTILYSLQQMKRLFLTDASVAILKLITAIILIFAGFSYFGPLVGFLLSAIAVALYRFKWFPMQKGKPDKKLIWKYAVPAFIGGFGSILINQGNIFALTFFGNMSSIGVFTIAFMFTTPMRMIPSVISTAIFPITSQEWAKKEKKRIRNLISQTLRYSYMASIPMLFVFVFFSREFILFFTTPEYLSAVFSFKVLAIAYALFGFGVILLGILYYTDKPNLNRNINIGSGIINILLSLALIPFLGILGASIAFLSASFYLFLSSFYYGYKHLRFSLELRSFAKILLSSLIMALALFLMRQINETLPWILLSIAVSSIVYFACLLLLKFFKGVDVRILKELERKTPKKFKPIIKILIKTINSASK